MNSSINKLDFSSGSNYNINIEIAYDLNLVAILYDLCNFDKVKKVSVKLA